MLAVWRRLLLDKIWKVLTIDYQATSKSEVEVWEGMGTTRGRDWEIAQ